MSSPLPPELRKENPLQLLKEYRNPEPEPSMVYRDPEPPMELPKPAPVSSPVNPNAGMPGKALAIQREQAKKAMMNPSGTTASGRVKTGIPFDEASRAHGMQIPARPVTPSKSVAPPKQVIKTPPEQVIKTPPVNPNSIQALQAKYGTRPQGGPPMKAGGSVKKMATGGMVKASRGDGIASRGRTRGKLC
jgi:hypothetical protein